MIKNSFKFKLLFSYVFIILISFGIIAFFLDINLEKSSLRDIKSSLASQASLIENQINIGNLQRKDFSYLDSFVKSLSPKAGCRITVIDREGRVLADSEEPPQYIPKMENHADRPEIRSALEGNAGEEIRYSKTLKIDMLYSAVPVRDRGEIIGAVRLALPLKSVQDILFMTRKTIFLNLVFALCLAFILGWAAIAGIVKPMNKIINASRKFSRGEFSHRIYQVSGDEMGQLAAILNQMAQDIEDKIKKIEMQNQHLKAIFENMVEGIIVVDKEGSLVSVNPTVERIFSVKKAELEGRPFLEVIRNNDISEIITGVLKNGEFISREISLVWPVQKVFYVNACAIFKSGEIDGVILVIHDVTEIRKLETIRRDFVANVSHELKTPLTSIKGFVETLMDGALEDKENSKSFLNIIKEHASRLEHLIGDLLELSRIESGNIKLNIEKINLKSLFEEVVEGFKAQTDKKAIWTQNNLTSGLTIGVDKNKLRQVISNLIDNAIKFNNDNGVVKIYAEDIPGGTKIVVEDSGIGIPAKDIPRIFERFYRVDKARSRELGGTGLGLSIVKHIVELHSGSVGVESTEGIGSKFWFTLPK